MAAIVALFAISIGVGIGVGLLLGPLAGFVAGVVAFIGVACCQHSSQISQAEEGR